MDKQLLIHYSLYKIKNQKNIKAFLSEFYNFSDKTHLYITTPFRSEYDLLIFNVINLDKLNNFFNNFTKHTFYFRNEIELVELFWGFTKKSVYTKEHKSSQEIDPFSDERKNYFIVYPFIKKSEWYLLSFEERKEMMFEHIKIGKKYKEILQLLVYSFGLNDSEFVVAYETDNLILFEELVEELRSSKARIYTKKDTPIITGIYKKQEDIINAF